METEKLIEILNAKAHGDETSMGEPSECLYKTEGIEMSILEAMRCESVPVRIKEAAVVELKNIICSKKPNEVEQIPLNEVDDIRDGIMEAMINSPDLIRNHLEDCLGLLLEYEFPSGWKKFVEKITALLKSSSTSEQHIALVCTKKLAQSFSWKDKTSLKDIMCLLLPEIYRRAREILEDLSDAALLQEILKVLYTLVRCVLLPDIMSLVDFAHWTETFYDIVEIEVSSKDAQEKKKLASDIFDCKKWALRIFNRLLEIYGNPDDVGSDAKEFSEHYLDVSSDRILTAVLKILLEQDDAPSSADVLHQALNYLKTATTQQCSWDILESRVEDIIQKVAFPLMCYSQQDEELWNTDARQYIHMKYDRFEKYDTLVTAAQSLLCCIMERSKYILLNFMGFTTSILENSNSTTFQKYAALHMMGSVAHILLNEMPQELDIETLLVNFIYPELNSEYGYMRARAFWTLHCFGEFKFSKGENLTEGLKTCLHNFLHDLDLPVKVASGAALHSLITNHTEAREYVEPHCKEVTFQLLDVIRETENEELTTALQIIIFLYSEQLVESAIDIASHLQETFLQVMEMSKNDDLKHVYRKADFIMCVLKVIHMVLSTMKNSRGVMAALEPIILNIVENILSEKSRIKIYQEATLLICSLSAYGIPEELWKVLDVMHREFKNGGYDCFSDMMPALYSFIARDTDAFLSNEKRIETILDMCQTVLTRTDPESMQCCAAKLLEIIILQCKGKIDKYIPPIVEIAVKKLCEDIRSLSLKTLCIQIIIAAMFYESQLLLETLEKIKISRLSVPVLDYIVEQWMKHTDCFLGVHECKICILGLCTLITVPFFRNAVTPYSKRVIPAILILLEGLKSARRSSTECEDISDERNQEEDGSSEVTREMAGLKVNTGVTEADAFIKADLEFYTTSLDIDDVGTNDSDMLKTALEKIQSDDSEWYDALTTNLTPADKATLEYILKPPTVEK